MDRYISKLSDQLHMMFFENENINDKGLLNKFFVHENGNEFDTKYFDLFIELVAYLYTREHDVKKLFNDFIPEIMPPLNDKVDFITFRNYMRSYKGLEVPQEGDVVVEKQDYYNVIHNAIVNNVLIDDGFWLNVDSQKIDNKKKEETDIAKLLIPVNNSNLYLFSTLFLTKCEERNIDYKFKINTDNTKQLGNNIEVSVNHKNYPIIMDIINTIIADFPLIFIDKDKIPSISYPLSDQVGVVPLLYGESYEEKMCKTIIYLKNTTRNFGEFKEELGKYINYYLRPLVNRLNEDEKNDEKKLH